MKRVKGRLPPFVPLLKDTMKTAAWKALSHGARSLYGTLKGRYNIKLHHPPVKYRLREFIAGVTPFRKTGANSNEKGDGCVDLEMRLGWLRCAPAERPLQMLARVGSKGKSDRLSGGSAAGR
jgi:hypothetical protein